MIPLSSPEPLYLLMMYLAPHSTVSGSCSAPKLCRTSWARLRTPILSGILFMCRVRIVMKRLFRFRLSPSPTSVLVPQMPALVTLSARHERPSTLPGTA